MIHVIAEWRIKNVTWLDEREALSLFGSRGRIPVNSLDEIVCERKEMPCLTHRSQSSSRNMATNGNHWCKWRGTKYNLYTWERCQTEHRGTKQSLLANSEILQLLLAPFTLTPSHKVFVQHCTVHATVTVLLNSPRNDDNKWYEGNAVWCS